MDSDFDPAWFAWKNCKCGGKLRFNLEELAVEHTQPMCAAFNALDVNELFKVPGALGFAIFQLQAKPSA